jgi:hypothetical protein
LVSEQVHAVQDVDEGASQSVDAPDHDSVPFLGVIQQLFHPWAIDCTFAARSDIGENVAPLDTSSDERIELKLRVLPRGAHAGVPKKSHALTVAQKPSQWRSLRQVSVRWLSETPVGLIWRGPPVVISTRRWCLRKL